jgi:hypothetical protein
VGGSANSTLLWPVSTANMAWSVKVFYMNSPGIKFIGIAFPGLWTRLIKYSSGPLDVVLLRFECDIFA